MATFPTQSYENFGLPSWDLQVPNGLSSEAAEVGRIYPASLEAESPGLMCNEDGLTKPLSTRVSGYWPIVSLDSNFDSSSKSNFGFDDSYTTVSGYSITPVVTEEGYHLRHSFENQDWTNETLPRQHESAPTAMVPDRQGLGSQQLSKADNDTVVYQKNQSIGRGPKTQCIECGRVSSTASQAR